MLDQIRDFHGQLSDKAAQQWVKILLDHMSSHERILQQGLSAYEDDATRQVLDSRVTCRHCEEILAICELIPITPELSVDAITMMA